MVRALVLLGLVSALACDSGTEPPAAAAAAPTATTAASPNPEKESKPKPPAEPELAPPPAPPVEAVEAPPVEAPSGDFLAQVQALPPIDGAANPNIDAARARNKAALSQHSKKEFTDSARGFMEAVTLDPGHVVARYNLSCALAMESQDEAAFAVLDQLADAGCPSCLAQVLVAKRDADWRKYKSDPRLKAVTKRAAKKLEKPKNAAQSVLTWLGTGPTGSAPGTVSERTKIKLTADYPPNFEQKPLKASTANPKVLKRWIEKETESAINGFNTGDFKIGACKDGCCETQRADEHWSANTFYVRKICFRVEDGLATVLKSVLFMHS